jgi:hypothetical protein
MRVEKHPNPCFPEFCMKKFGIKKGDAISAHDVGEGILYFDATRAKSRLKNAILCFQVCIMMLYLFMFSVG